ncbi:MAG TPA: asparagine synthase (glutamine-hydrolyzing) [Thermoleophilaceae bacterium]
MCGIAGLHSPGERVDEEVVRAMAAQLVHRGPDGEGAHVEEDVGLGMRRLAIIDPAHGHQPLYNESRDVVAVFNGELYDHREVRRWLEGRGHRFDSGSDGEVLPHLYEELGDRFVDRLNGIFAVALWDRRTRTLHLARDKFGVKPLYYSRRGAGVAFASELRALLADGRVSRELDHQAIDHFLTFRFTPAPSTLLADVRKLPPASVLSVGPDGARERVYWRGEMTNRRRDRRHLVEEYREAFERAVVRQMMSDRPIALMLSGGVDSGAIAAVMAEHSSRVHTFTVGFGEGGDADETALAEATARRFGTDHESAIVGPGEYLARIPDSLRLLEEPVGSTSALAVNFVAELIRPHAPVALSGQGADEPLGGYWRHLGTKISQVARPLGPLAAAAGPLVGRLPGERVRRGVGAMQSSDLDLLMATYRVLSDEDKDRLYAPALRERRNGSRPAGEVEALRREVAHLEPLAQMLYVDTRFWLPHELLLIADKMTMAASVELRVPFLDQDLVALVETMHSSQKVRGLSRKSLHKRAMLRWLPREVVYRKERGWATPMSAWLRAELRPLLEEVLLGEGELARELFDERETRRLIEAHASGRADQTRHLFCLLSLGLWYREFGTGGPAPGGSGRPAPVAAA